MQFPKVSSFYSNSGPLGIHVFEGFLFSEKYRTTSTYFNSWQNEWKLIWLRPSIKTCYLNISKLRGENVAENNKPKQCRYSRLYDIEGKENLIILEEQRVLESFSNIGDLMDFMKSTTTSKLDMQVKLHVDKLNTLMNKGLPELIYFDNHLTSSSDCFLDNFDSPLSLMDNLDQEIKESVVQIGPAGLLTPLQHGYHDLPNIHLCHVGCKLWFAHIEINLNLNNEGIIIHPSSRMQLLQRVSDCFHRSKKGPQATVDVHCILRDGAFSVTFDQLDSWEILYTVLLQEDGDILMLLPGVIRFTYNPTFCVTTSMNYLTLSQEDAQVVQNHKKCTCFRSKMDHQAEARHGYWNPSIPSSINSVISTWMYSTLLEMHPVIPQDQNITTQLEPHGKQKELCSIGGVETSPNPTNDDTSDLGKPVNQTLLQSSDQNDVIIKQQTTTSGCISTQDFILSENMLISKSAYDMTDNDVILCISDAAHNEKENAHEGYSNLYMDYRQICSDLEQFFENYPSPGVHIMESCLSEVVGSDEISSSSSSSIWEISSSESDSGISSIMHHDLPELVTTMGPVSPIVPNNISSPYKETSRQKSSTTTRKQKKSFPCSECRQVLSTKAHLNRHTYLKHSTADISVQCPICLKKFANEMNLQRHRRLLPPSEEGSLWSTKRKKNLCRGRDESFAAEDSRFRCEICGQRFILKSGYNRHLRRKHS
ncbi:Zinc finger protein PLAG1 [Folsomia candida]|uniref:Zinc finger protein PLAG1 n=1 Tax=Folsomia candida TaxID=158441 RepID=A0A226ETU9_FOLCA|nr:Zinc finger protein PLAG1 [Folsomia candida]